MSPLVIAALLLASGSTPLDGAFTALAERPSAAELQCAGYSRQAWLVSLAEDRVVVSPRPNGLAIDPLPFRTSGRDQEGERHVLEVDDGWLVGFDGGEFGGGLWWFSPGGDASRRIRPAPDAPSDPGDIFRAENVQGFAQLGDVKLVLMGLDHLTGRSGWIFRLARRAGEWVLTPFAVLDARPRGWVEDGARLLVLTGSGLWSVREGVARERLHALDPPFYPRSMVRGSDGALYVGMRRYVLRLEPSAIGWRETWLVRADCVHATVVDYDCRCTPPSPAAP